MKFESLENLWDAQQPIGPAGLDSADRGRTLAKELARRSRMLGYSYFFRTLGLVVVPLLAIINFNYARPDNVILFVLNALLVATVSALLLVGTIRRHRRLRALSREKADGVASYLAASVENLEAEMQDFQTSRWGLAVCIGISLLAIYVNQPITKFGWQPFASRAAVVLAATALVLLVVARHRRKNLEPELRRRKDLLQQLS